MKDKTNGCCIVSCAFLVLSISLPAMIDATLYSGNTPLLPHSTQAAIRNGDCLAGVILLRVSVCMNNINCSVNTSTLKLMAATPLDTKIHLRNRSKVMTKFAVGKF